MENLISVQPPLQRLNLSSIEASLRAVQSEFPRINQAMNLSRERMDDEMLENLLSGYALLNQLLEAKVDLLGLGGSPHLLDLNICVLCGTDEHKRLEYKKHIKATRRYFYERAGAGIDDLSEWYAMHRHESVWQRAAGAYIRILSEPQVFIEGNDRTGTLVMSYILASEGQPPFVLNPANAMAYFDSSTQIKRMTKNGLSSLFLLPRMKARVASFLQAQANPVYCL
jgi:hypothetical protein